MLNAASLIPLISEMSLDAINRGSRSSIEQETRERKGVEAGGEGSFRETVDNN